MSIKANQNICEEKTSSYNTCCTPIERETRSHIPTEEAAIHVNRKPQTMRHWACFENGPIKPIRINGRLAWSVKEIKELLGVEV